MGTVAQKKGRFFPGIKIAVSVVIISNLSTPLINQENRPLFPFYFYILLYPASCFVQYPALTRIYQLNYT